MKRTYYIEEVDKITHEKEMDMVQASSVFGVKRLATSRKKFNKSILNIYSHNYVLIASRPETVWKTVYSK